MITKPGHTNYFVGINIGNTWAETKDDSREAPVLFVNRMVKRYKLGEFTETWIDDPGAYVAAHRKTYIQERIGEVIKKLQPDVDVTAVDLPLIMKEFTNYTVRSYVDDYAQNHEINKKDFSSDDDYDDAVWASKLETWILDVYGEGKKIKGLDGTIRSLSYNSSNDTQVTEEPDYAELFEDDVYADNFWSFDEESIGNGYTGSDNLNYAEEDEEEDFVEAYYKNVRLDTSQKKVRTVADLIVDEKKYENIFESRNQFIFKVRNKQQMEKCKVFLKNYVTDKGKSIMFKTPIGSHRWLKVSGVPLTDLDEFIKNL